MAARTRLGLSGVPTAVVAFTDKGVTIEAADTITLTDAVLIDKEVMVADSIALTDDAIRDVGSTRNMCIQVM